MGTAISCTECSKMVGLISTVGRDACVVYVVCVEGSTKAWTSGCLEVLKHPQIFGISIM